MSKFYVEVGDHEITLLKADSSDNIVSKTKFELSYSDNRFPISGKVYSVLMNVFSSLLK